MTDPKPPNGKDTRRLYLLAGSAVGGGAALWGAGWLALRAFGQGAKAWNAGGNGPHPAATLACHDRNPQSGEGVATVMREPNAARKPPIVRLADDDFDGVYDDRPAQAAAAA